MSYANGIIKDSISGNGDGVSVYDVLQALGDVAGGGTALTENGLNALCTHVNINPWARFKPERSLPFTEAERNSLTNPYPLGPYQIPLSHTIRKLHNFGLDVPYCNHCVMNNLVCSIVYDEDNTYIPWKYLTPRGDRRNFEIAAERSAEFYRLSDFVRKENDSEGPTSAQLPGYNHYAKPPLECWVDSQGIAKKTISMYGKDITCYEVNRLNVKHKIINGVSTPVLTIWFLDKGGYDLRTLDFVDFSISNSDSTNSKWRPVVQIFNNDKENNSDPDWYDRSSPDVEISGDEIPNINWSTYDGLPSTAWSIEIPIDSSYTDSNNNGSSGIFYYHACIGIGYCEQDLNNIWTSSVLNDNKKLFLLPCTEFQLNNNIYPFYFIFNVVNHNVRNISVNHIAWGNQIGNIGHQQGDNDFTIPSNSLGQLYITLNITLNSQLACFRNYNNNIPSNIPTDAVPLKIRLLQQNSPNIYYLTPVTEGRSSGTPLGYAWYNSQNDNSGTYTTIPIKSSEEVETKKLYARVDDSNGDNGLWVSNLANNTYHLFIIQSTINTDNSNWAEIGSFGIKKGNI